MISGLDEIRLRFQDEHLAERIWRGDPTVWGPEQTPELADRLGWLRLHETMRSQIEKIDQIAAEALEAGFDDVVVLGMGGSSLAPEVFAAVFGSAPGHPRLTVLDSTHPDQVRRVEAAIDPGHTIFLVASKSGTTLETLSGYRYFWERSGMDGSRFIAITDPGTPLAALGQENGFRAVVHAPSDVGGRFSALTHFGLLPAALIGVDLQSMLDAAAEAAGDHDSPVDLGVMWGAAAVSGIDKLTFMTPPGLAALPVWMEQLVAESLGKDGKGIVPIAGEPTLQRYENDRLFVSLRLAGEVMATPPAGHPVIHVEVADRYGVAGEMLRAEVATATAGAVLGVHPFNQPDVEAAKALARRALLGEPARVEAIDYFHPALADRIDDLVSSLRQGDYFALQAYLPYEPESDAAMAELRRKVGDMTGAATTAGYGPRFLHSTGQLHKGGPNTGVFLQLVDRPRQDLDVPGTEASFGRIISAQALGDYAALKDAGRRVMSVDLGEDRMAGLEALMAAFG
jgi:transaldolase/glucose-6-phosphate isomerase